MKVLIVGEGPHEGAGALRTLVERLAGRGPLDCAFRRVKDANVHAHHGKSSGMEKKAIRWMLDARRDGYDAIVFLVDEDGEHGRVGQVERAQADRTSDIRRAVGVAVRTFDAWMLADEQALSHALGRQVGRQPEPEQERDAKGRCAALLAQSDLNVAQRDLYHAVAERVDLDRLGERCPRGFAPFADRVRALFARPTT